MAPAHSKPVAREARYTEETVQRALKAHRDGMSLRQAEAAYGVPKTTLRNRLNGSAPKGSSGEVSQRISSEIERKIARWILLQEKAGHAPTHANVRYIIQQILKEQGDMRELGKKYMQQFIKRNPSFKTKLGRRLDYKRINAAHPDNVEKFHQLYAQFDWIKRQNRHNADEYGIMRGKQGNGPVIGTSDTKGAFVKSNEDRSWSTVIELITADGRLLNPCLIYKGHSVQTQWFRDQLLLQDPSMGDWHVGCSENGWTSNDIAVEWLEKVYLPQTMPDNPEDWRLLVVNGHGSHVTDEFRFLCFINKVYVIWFPAHTPLDVSVISVIKRSYRTLIGRLGVVNDAAPIDHVKFIALLSQARKSVKRETVISGWKETGLWPVSKRKTLSSPFVQQAAEIAANAEAILSERNAEKEAITDDIKSGRDIAMALESMAKDRDQRSAVRGVCQAYDEMALEIAKLRLEVQAKDEEIQRLQPRHKKKARRTDDGDQPQRLWRLYDVVQQSIEDTERHRAYYEKQYSAERQQLLELRNLAPSFKGYVEPLSDDNSSSQSESEIFENSDEEEEDLNSPDGPDPPVLLRSSRRVIRAPARYYD